MLCLLLVPSAAWSQTSGATTGRTSTGLYQGDVQDNDSRQSLVLTGSVAEGYDDNVVGSEGLSRPDVRGQFRSGGMYSYADGRLAYRRRNSTNTVSFLTGGTAQLQYYPELSGQITQPIDSYTGSAAVETRAGRGSFRAAQEVGYQPYFVLAPLPS
jgi:hypothetical protein